MNLSTKLNVNGDYLFNVHLFKRVDFNFQLLTETGVNGDLGLNLPINLTLRWPQEIDSATTQLRQMVEEHVLEKIKKKKNFSHVCLNFSEAILFTHIFFHHLMPLF